MLMLADGLWKLAILWRDAKNVIEGDAATGNVFLHFAAGFLIFLICGAVMKSRRRWTIAWVLTLIAAVFNEIVDITTERWPDITQQLAEGAQDLAATMALPSVFLILAALPKRSLTDESARRF